MKTRTQYAYTTQDQIRTAFWDTFPDLTRRTGPRGRTLPQNQQPADTRMAFVDYLESLHRDGQVSDALAQRATL